MKDHVWPGDLTNLFPVVYAYPGGVGQDLVKKLVFKAIRQERLYLKVAEQLSAHIDSGAIAVGDRLPSECDLAQQFGVSRPTIREAMIALELAGRVEIRSGSGVYILDGDYVKTAASHDDAPGPMELLEARYQ